MSNFLIPAIVARSKFQDRKIEQTILAKLYKSYNAEVEDADKFVKQATRLFPKLNCGLTSVYLQHILKQGKVVQGSYKNQDHTFLLIGEEIIDITADQFGGPKVYVGPLAAPWSLTPSRT